MNKNPLNSLKAVIATVLFAFISQVLYAIPANPTPVTIRQPDGRTLTFIIQGDEHVSWAKTLDQYSLCRNSEGFWTYAVLNDKGNMVSSQYLAVNKEERTGDENKFLTTLPFNLHYSSEQVKQMRERFNYVPNPNDNKYPTEGSVKLLVILVAFSDLPFTYTNANFVSLVSDSNYNGTGSVKDYYLANSNGHFSMDIDVVGPVTLPNSMAYYGQDGSYHDINMQYFVQHALSAANTAGTNFALYDNDNDGKVDAIHFIFAGTPQSSTQNTNEIWPHRSSMYGVPNYNGKVLQGQPYSCSAEKRNASSIDGIGTICHEFGHVLGYPDMYDTDYEGSGGESNHPGKWDIMASGSYNNNGNTPAGLNAWEKAFCNWISPDTLTSAADSLVLSPLTRDTIAYCITLPNNEFFMLEHRKQESWDAYLPGQGMLIWHGDNDNLSINGNSVNCNPNNRNWFLEPANGNYNQTEMPSAPFPGTTGNTAFTDNSSPASLLKNGSLTNKSITDIRYVNDSTIVFNFMSNYPAIITNSQVANSVHGTYATVSGYVLHYGTGSLMQQGFYWSINPDSVNANANIVIGTMSNDSVIATLTSLPPSTTIYYRAFVTNAYGTVTGNQRSFMTLSGLGLVTTAVATSIGDNTATLGGNLINVGDGVAVDKGIVYTSNPNINPTTADSMVSAGNAALGAFSVNVTGLQECVRYYYRAYVTTDLGTSYGSKLNFRTTYPAINNNQINGNETLCAESVPTLVTGTEPTGGLGNFTYLWEQKGRTGNNWIAANGTNNTQNYQSLALTDSTFYRRIVFSNGTITDTSNTILKDVHVSRGGNLTKLIGDTILLGQTTDTMTLSGNIGTVIDWERQLNTELWQSLGNTTNKYIETPEVTGSYAYRVAVQLEQCPAAYSTIQTIVVDANALADANGNTVNINIYPNPSNGLFTITCNIKGYYSLIINNAVGQTVYESSNTNLQKQNLDLRHLDNGVYFLTIIADNQQIKKQILIKK